MDWITIGLTAWALGATFILVLGYRSKKTKKDGFISAFGRSEGAKQ